MGRMPAGRSLDVVNGQLDAASPGLFKDSLPANYPPNLVKDYLTFTLRAAPGAAGVSSAAKPLCRSAADPAADHGARAVHCLHQSGEPRPRASLCACARVRRPTCGGRLVGSSRPATHGRERVDRARWGASPVLSCAMVHQPIARRAARNRAVAGSSARSPVDRVHAGGCVARLLTFGLIPAWRASRVSAVDAMRATVRSPSGGREGDWTPACAGDRAGRLLARAPLRRAVVHGARCETCLAVDARLRIPERGGRSRGFLLAVDPTAEPGRVHGDRAGQDSPDPRRDLGGRGAARAARWHRQQHDRAAETPRRNHCDERGQGQRRPVPAT